MADAAQEESPPANTPKEEPEGKVSPAADGEAEEDPQPEADRHREEMPADDGRAEPAEGDSDIPAAPASESDVQSPQAAATEADEDSRESGGESHAKEGDRNDQDEEESAAETAESASNKEELPKEDAAVESQPEAVVDSASVSVSRESAAAKDKGDAAGVDEAPKAESERGEESAKSPEKVSTPAVAVAKADEKESVGAKECSSSSSKDVKEETNGNEENKMKKKEEDPPMPSSPEILADQTLSDEEKFDRFAQLVARGKASNKEVVNCVLHLVGRAGESITFRGALRGF